MWFNSMQREEPYLALTCLETFQRWSAFGNQNTGGAWLSSARVVRCWVKSRNERNPFPYLPAFRMGTLRILPVTNWRKVGTTSNHHGPYVLGYTRATMASTESSYQATGCESQKAGLSSDWSLQLDSMKLESLVIGYQP